MKKLLIFCVAGLAFYSACNGGDSSTTNRDSVDTTLKDTTGGRYTLLPPPSSNSDATNPSMPDTTIIKTDSARKK